MAYFNPFRPSYIRNPYAALARLRAEEPVHYSEAVEAWVVTSFPESISVLQDYETFSSNPVRAGSHVSQSLKYVQANSALGNVERLAQLDSVAHQRLRGIVSKGFVPKTLEALRLDIRNQLAALISENVGRPERPLDVVQRLAAHIPEIVLGLQLGLVDEDREQVMTDTFALMQTNFSDVTIARKREARAARDRMLQFLESAQNDGRVESTSVLGLIATKTSDSEDLSIEELLALVVDLAQAGSATTAETIANGVLLLATQPSIQHSLRSDPDRIPAAISELLRFEPPQQVLVRWATKDTVLGAQAIHENEAILILVGGANRDPAIYSDPEEFQLGRFDSGGGEPPSIAFGRGPHYCIGAPLAMLTLEEFFKEFLISTKSFALADEISEATLPRSDDWFSRGPMQLPIVVDA